MTVIYIGNYIDYKNQRISRMEFERRIRLSLLLFLIIIFLYFYLRKR